MRHLSRKRSTAEPTVWSFPPRFTFGKLTARTLGPLALMAAAAGCVAAGLGRAPAAPAPLAPQPAGEGGPLLAQVTPGETGPERRPEPRPEQIRRGNYSRRPAPLLPEPLFFELMRPLAALQLNTEVNYLVAVPTQTLPEERLIEVETVVLDWTALEFAATFKNERLEEYLFGLQQTLGVGTRENWVHGIWLQFPIVAPHLDNILGARPLYIFQWRPTKDHWFAWFQAMGAERLAFLEEGEPEGIWRPFLVVAAFLDITSTLDFAVEVHARAYDDEHGFFLALPQLLWGPSHHVELTLGAGWMREHGVNDYPIMFRLFLHWPSQRLPCTAEENPLACDNGWLGGVGWLLE